MVTTSHTVVIPLQHTASIHIKVIHVHYSVILDTLELLHQLHVVMTTDGMYLYFHSHELGPLHLDVSLCRVARIHHPVDISRAHALILVIPVNVK